MVTQSAEQEIGWLTSLERCLGLVGHLILGGLDEFDRLASPGLEGSEKLRDRRILLGVEPLSPPDDEVGGAGGERRQHERGGEEDGPDPHGALPNRLRATAWSRSQGAATGGCRLPRPGPSWPANHVRGREAVKRVRVIVGALVLAIMATAP